MNIQPFEGGRQWGVERKMSPWFIINKALPANQLRVMKLWVTIIGTNMKKEEEEVEEQKPTWQSNMKYSQKQMAYITNKPFKSQVKVIKDDVFMMRSVKNAAQFFISLLNIADYVQLKYNNEVGDAMQDLKHPLFNYPEMPEEKIVIDKEGNQIIEQPNEMKEFMWKKHWDRVNT